MGGRMNGRTVIVTGGAQGIGEATVRLMVAEGGEVIIADRNVEKSETLADEIRSGGGKAHVVPVDMNDRDQIAAMIDRSMEIAGKIDVLVNNAAAVHLDSVDLNIVDIDLDVWDEIVRVNLDGPMLASRRAIPHMLENGGGSIVMIASMAHRLASGYRVGYDTTKAGLVQMTRSIAVAFGKQNVRANVVAPGLTLSPSVLAQIPAPMRQVFLDHTMLPTIGEPHDQASAILFLASDESRFVNGAVLEVDGGLGAHLPPIPALARLG